MIYLRDILTGIEFETKDDITGIKVNKVTSDSRTLAKGDMFIAINGCSLDGHRFIKEAVSKGAKVIVLEKDFDSPLAVKKILIRDIRRAVPIIANNFYKHPAGKLKVMGITGTNGKTTIAYLIESILKKAGRETGVIGTINYRFKDRILRATNTTPGPLELQAILAEMVKEGTPYVIIEVSSHSLDQHRIDGILFDIAIFTNITSEHMDYHKTFVNYFDAKAKLFDHLKDGGVGILNSDDEVVLSLKKTINKRVITYGLSHDADIRAKNMKPLLDGSQFFVETPMGSIEIKTRLIGTHNISNILASIAASFAEGIDLETISGGIESLVHVPGRLERIEAGQPFKVFIDYAHTEDALYNIFSLLKKVKKKRIITVFGCGGNRDRKKRPLMGHVACRFSDHVIITSDNPRHEEPRQIINEIEDGIRGEFSNYDIIEDRREAIESALEIAAKDDIVVIAGKGHEKYQIFKDKVTPFDDCEVVRSILNKRYEPRTFKDSKNKFNKGAG